MNTKERELVRKVFDLLHSEIYLNIDEPDPTDIWEIAKLEQKREVVKNLRHELLGRDL